MNKTKTNHQTGYHKPVVNPTTNYPKDGHKDLCKRCLERYHGGICPMTHSKNPSGRCDL
jgi:hypothetical protein